MKESPQTSSLAPWRWAGTCAVLAGLSSCVGGLPRTVVPPHIFKYAGKSNRDIVNELPVTQAITVLEELGRVHSTSTFTVTPDWTLGEKPNTDPLVFELKDKSGVPVASLYSEVRRPVLQSGQYFSTLTAVAIEERLDPPAIPALVVGYRPDFDDGVADFIRNSGVGFDLICGGALNGAGAGSDSDLELAVGLGITIPWSDSGAFSIGAVTWREESMDDMGMSMDNTEIAMYIGISLGSFNVSDNGQ